MIFVCALPCFSQFICWHWFNWLHWRCLHSVQALPVSGPRILPAHLIRAPSSITPGCRKIRYNAVRLWQTLPFFSTKDRYLANRCVFSPLNLPGMDQKNKTKRRHNVAAIIHVYYIFEKKIPFHRLSFSQSGLSLWAFLHHNIINRGVVFFFFIPTVYLHHYIINSQQIQFSLWLVGLGERWQFCSVGWIGVRSRLWKAKHKHNRCLVAEGAPLHMLVCLVSKVSVLLLLTDFFLSVLCSSFLPRLVIRVETFSCWPFGIPYLAFSWSLMHVKKQVSVEESMCVCVCLR